MTIFKRVQINLIRQPMKSLPLFGVIFLLAMLTSGAISVRQAIMITDQSLRAQLPAIATLHQDIEAINSARNKAIDETIVISPVYASLIREIGELDYVRLFDYTAWGFNFFSEALSRAFNSELFSLLQDFDSIPIDWKSLRATSNLNLERFILRGVHTAHIIDIEAGLINLVEGRVFNEYEVKSGALVVFVSEDFMEINNLSLGDTIELHYNIYDGMFESGELLPDEYYQPSNILNSKIFELEIIGVFNHLLSESIDLEMSDIHNHIRIINQLYVPNALIESTISLYIETFEDLYPDRLTEILSAESLEELIAYENILFLLYDPLDFAAFSDAADRILPDFWVISDLSNTYADIAHAMKMIDGIAFYLVLGSISATFIVLTLLVSLFLQDRKNEMGIYLALGERKIKLVSGFLLEIFLVSSVALTIGLLVGNRLSSILSEELLQSEMQRQLLIENSEDNITVFSELESMGFRHVMTHEEMLSFYEVRLELQTIIVFYGLNFTIMFIGTFFSTAKIWYMNPKDILIL